MADLMTALRNADAAGDTDAANRISAMIRQQKTAPEQPLNPKTTEVSNEIKQPEKRGIGEQILGGLSGAASLASDYAGSSVAGLTALVDTINPFTDNDPEVLIEQIKSKFKIDPNEGGEAALNQLASAIEPAKPLIDAVSKFKETAGQQGLDATNSPAFATFVNMIPDIIAEASGFSAVKRGATSKAIKPEVDQAKVSAVAEVSNIEDATGIKSLSTDVMPPETRLGKLMQGQGELVAGFQRKGQQEQRVRSIEKLANKYDIVEGVGFESKIVQGLKNSINESKEAIGKLYDESTSKLDQLGNVPLSKTKKFAESVIDRELKKGSRADNSVIEDMQTLIDAPDDLSFELVKEIRSAVGANLEKVNRGAPVQGNTDTALLKRTYGQLTSDMKDFATSADPDLALKWKKANAVVSEFATGTSKRGAKSVIKNGDATPEIVDTLLFSGKNSDIDFLSNNLDEAGKGAAKQRILQRALDKSSIEGDNINPNKFLTQLNKTKTQIDKFFDGDEKKALLALKDQLGNTRRAQDASVTTPTGQQLSIAAALAIPSALIPGVLQGIVESKPIRDLLIRSKAAKTAEARSYIGKQLEAKVNEAGLGGALAVSTLSANSSE